MFNVFWLTDRQDGNVIFQSDAITSKRALPLS